MDVDLVEPKGDERKLSLNLQVMPLEEVGCPVPAPFPAHWNEAMMAGAGTAILAHKGKAHGTGRDTRVLFIVDHK